jgi:glucose/arabinose dehydrogenase
MGKPGESGCLAFLEGIRTVQTRPPVGQSGARLSRVLRFAVLFSILTNWNFGFVAGAADVLPDIPAGTLQVKLTLVASNLHHAVDGTTQINPTATSTDGSGRLFITTLGGVIRIVNPQGALLATPYLNTTRDPATGSPDPRAFNVSFRHGQTSLAFHPQFHQRGKPGFGKFYTILDQNLNSGTADFLPFYQDSSSPPTPFDQVLMEWTAANPDADVFSGTRREIFRIRQPKDDHNANQLLFGPDGYLYMDVADGGNVRDNQLPPNPGLDGTSAHSQNRSVIFGKIIRLDPLHPSLTPGSGDLVSANGNYRIPISNPFAVDGNTNTLAEIYAYGHRNTYGLSFDPVNCHLYSGEVGQVTIEEVNRILPGGNYGWNLKEGGFVYNEASQANVLTDTNGQFALARGLTDPILQYDHGDGQSIVGGGVYRGRAIPALYGKYIFGDLQGKRVGGVLQGARLFYGNLTNGGIFELLLSPDSAPLPKLIYSVQTDEDGEYYITGGPSSFTNGVVLKIGAPGGPASYANWATALLPAGQQNPGDRPFGDGIPNLMRFAFAIPPNALCKPPANPLRFSLQSSRVATIAYRASAPGVIYRPQWSSDLVTWNTATNGALLGGQVISVTNQGPEFRVTFPATQRLFTRVQVELQ